LNISYNAPDHYDQQPCKGHCVVPCMEVFSVFLERRFKRASHDFSATERMFLLPLDLTEALVLVCDQEGGLTFGDAPSLVGVPLISIMYSMPVGGQVYSFVHDFDENEMVSIHRTPSGYRLRNANRTSIFERYTFKGEEILQFIENK